MSSLIRATLRIAAPYSQFWRREPTMAETRKLGEQERLLNYLHALGGLIAISAMHVRGLLEAERLRAALDWAQAQHPILRAHIEYGGLVFLQPAALRLSPAELCHRRHDADTAAYRRTTPIPRHGGRYLPRNCARPSVEASIRACASRSSGSRRTAELSHIIVCADHATLDAQSGNMLEPSSARISQRSRRGEGGERQFTSPCPAARGGTAAQARQWHPGLRTRHPAAQSTFAETQVGNTRSGATT